MIRHIVMIKFKKDAPKEKIDIFLEEVKKLPHLNKEIRDYSHGMCVHTRYHSADFDFANCCDIDSYEAMERYMSHWAHLRMTPFLPDILENMMSFDWEIDYWGPGFDAKAAKEEAEKEAIRVAPAHTNPKMAYVPEVRGQTVRKAREMLGNAGLKLDEDIDWVMGSVWAPDRIMMVEPLQGSEVEKGTSVKLTVTGDWLSTPAPAPGKSAW